MQVYSPLSAAFDNETTGAWVYRLRKLTVYDTGIEYIQYCCVSGTSGAANWMYGDWYITPQAKCTIDTTDTNDSNIGLGSNINPIFINSSGRFEASDATAGSGINPIYLNAGSLTASTSTVGNASRPMYLKNGALTECDVPTSGSWFKGVVTIDSDGVCDYGKYLDLHNSNTSTNDYDVRIQCDGAGKNIIYLPTITG
jgi:hypothetical protein